MSERGDAERLEDLWSGTFGDEYVERNAGSYGERGGFWSELVATTSCTSVLEIGCNVGGNLRWIAPLLPEHGTWGVDINDTALATIRRELPDVNAVWSPARSLPFRDGFFDLVFTAGVLIHQPSSTLPLVVAEMVRCSRRWILCAEYHADEEVEVPYRGHTGALFRRDYGRVVRDLFPELVERTRGFLGPEAGFDDVTWVLFEKPGP